MKKILIAALMTVFIAACGSSQTSQVTATPQAAKAVTAPRVVTAKAVLDTMAGAKFKDGELLVKFKANVAQKTLMKTHAGTGATLLKSYDIVPNLQHVKLPAGMTVQQAVELYMADPNVQYAEPNYVRCAASTDAADPYFTPQQWALNNTGTFANGTLGADIKARDAWDLTRGDRKVVVAVLDSGIDYNHPDLVGNIWTNGVKKLIMQGGIRWLGHDTFKISGERQIYTDPYNIAKSDNADIILISHDHYDHCSPDDVKKVQGPNTVIVTTGDCAQRLTGNIRTVKPGDKINVEGIDIEAVPAYNTNKMDQQGNLYHPKEKGWVGFVFTVKGQRIYFAGDTDLIPEMKSIKADIAFLPVSGTFVMTADEASQAAQELNPQLAIPMHYGTIVGSSADATNFADLLKGKIEVATLDENGTIQSDNTQFNGSDWRGWNFADNNNDPFDDLGHGTHVSGIIGAVGNNNIGIAGVMWNVRIMPLKIFSSVNKKDSLCGSATGFVADEISAIQYAWKKGANVINGSFHTGLDYCFSEYDAIAEAGANGVLFVAAAGNDTHNIDLDMRSPAIYDLHNVITVAATDQNDRLATFSNYGPLSVHIAAPGVNILSTIPTNRPSNFGITGYDFMDGTSMAAPFVSGAAGLIYSYYNKDVNHFDYRQVRGLLLRYVDTVADSQNLELINGRVTSNGRLNVYKALSALLQPTELTAAPASATAITLSWKDNARGEDFYVVERRPNDGTSMFTVVSDQVPFNTTSFTDSGLTPGASYEYRVKAMSYLPDPPSAGFITADSFYSNSAAATTPTNSGTLPTTTGGGGGGGCSIGTRQTASTAAADSLVLLLPLLVLGFARGMSRRK